MSQKVFSPTILIGGVALSLLLLMLTVERIR